MVAPIGADVVVFLESHYLQVNFFFLDRRTTADDGECGDQILARHRSTRHRLRVATAVVDRDPSSLFTLNTIAVTD